MARNNWAIWVGAAAFVWFGILRGVRAAKVTFDKLRIVGLQPDGLLYRVTVFVHNPLFVDILVNNIEGNVYVMSQHVATLDYPVNQRIRSFATTAFDLQFTAHSNSLGAALWESIQTGDPATLMVTFDGYVTIKGIKIPVRKEFTYDEIFKQ